MNSALRACVTEKKNSVSFMNNVYDAPPLQCYLPTWLKLRGRLRVFNAGLGLLVQILLRKTQKLIFQAL